jgi:ribonuclease E
MGKISSFGLMEISRQRRRTGILEGTTHICPHCQGAGRVRSVESSALSALRAVEMEGLRGGGEISLRVPPEVGLYILNAKRDYLMRLRQTHGLWVNVALDESLAAAENAIDRISSEAPPIAGRAWEPPPAEAYTPEADDDDFVAEEEDEEDEEEIEQEDEDDDSAAARSEDDEEDEDEDRPRAERGGDEEGRQRGRRRRRRGRRGEEPRPQAAAQQQPRAERPAQPQGEALDDNDPRKRRRRGRRGGRRMREEPRAGDVYAWSWPARPVGDDAYQWRGPVQAQLAPPPADAALSPEPVAYAPPQPRPELPDMPELAAAAAPPSSDEVWVELPATDEAPARKPSRPRRGRGRATAPLPEAIASGEQPDLAADAPVAEAEPAMQTEPAGFATAPAPEPEPVAAEAAPEPAMAEVVAEPEPPALPPEPAPRPYDANEIVAPPVSPRRGWWRRGG